MAYRRCITARTKQLCEQQRFAPPFSYINHDNDSNNQIAQSSNYLSPNRGFRTSNISNNHFQPHRFASPFNSAVYGSVFSRNMSTSVASVASAGVGKSKLMTGMDALADGSLEVAPVLYDSFLPVGSVQFLIDYIRLSTGLNWWASIVLTTILVRCLTFPVYVYQLKASSKFVLLKLKLKEINQEMLSRAMSQVAVSERQAKVEALFKEYNVSPFTAMKGVLVRGPVFIAFFIAVEKMAEKVPSFQQGGAYWFLDLTTPDEMYILPVLTALTYWILVEYNMKEGWEANPAAKTLLNFARVFAVLLVPMTMTFSKAIFFYWITGNVLTLMQAMVLKKPEVKKFLGIPVIPDIRPSPTNLQNPGFSFVDSIKKFHSATKQKEEKLAEQRERITSLEKEVEGKKEGDKKRT